MANATTALNRIFLVENIEEDTNIWKMRNLWKGNIFVNKYFNKISGDNLIHMIFSNYFIHKFAFFVFIIVSFTSWMPLKIILYNFLYFLLQHNYINVFYIKFSLPTNSLFYTITSFFLQNISKKLLFDFWHCIFLS